MAVAGTVVVYVIAGLVVAIWLWRREKRVGLAVAAIVFWPLLAPLLVTSRATVVTAEGPRLADLDRRLVEASASLQGLAAELVRPEIARVRSMLGSLRAMEKRLAELEALATTEEFDLEAGDRFVAALRARGVAEEDERVKSARSRLKSARRLHQLRTTAAEELERVVLRIDEMITQLRLLKFAGGGGEDVAKAVREVADAVEGLGEGLLGEEAA